MLHSLAGAIARRNVEPDGRIWRRGEIVIPSAAAVKAIRVETRRSMAERARTLRALRALHVNAGVEEVRAVLPADSSDETAAGAVARIMAQQAESQQYLADLELARHEWARRKYK